MFCDTVVKKLCLPGNPVYLGYVILIMENNSEKDRYEPTVKMLRTNKLKNHRKLQNNSKFLIINGKYC